MKRITIYKSFTFEASHVLPAHPGKCSRLHGHSWKLTVGVSGEVNKDTGFVCDYGVLGDRVKSAIVDVVDHQHLGCEGVLVTGTNKYQEGVFGPEFYPSSENLVIKFAELLNPFPFYVQLEEVALEETCTCKAVWRREDA